MAQFRGKNHGTVALVSRAYIHESSLQRKHVCKQSGQEVQILTSQWDRVLGSLEAKCHRYGLGVGFNALLPTALSRTAY